MPCEREMLDEAVRSHAGLQHFLIERNVGRQTNLDTWSHPLAVGQPLPSLPVWLSDTQTVSLDLEVSYEETCRVLRIS